MSPPTEDELDEAARRLIPKLDRLAIRNLEEPHDFDTEPDTEHRRQFEHRYGVHSDTLGLTDSLEVRVTREFIRRPCALGDSKTATAVPVFVIVELHAGTSGSLDLWLCPEHRQNLIDTYRSRSLANNSALHFAGRRIIAVDPRPLDVIDVLKSGGGAPYL